MSDGEQVAADDGDNNVEYNLLNEPTRIAGLVLMSLGLALAVYLAAWTLWHRQSPVVKAMQPAFLFMLPCGSVLTLLAIVPMGMNEFNTANIDAACISISWLESLGETIVLIALVAKLWRVNQIFQAAEACQRKVVTVKDVLWPFSILLSVNVLTLIVQTVMDPFVWKRDSIGGEASNTFGYCTSKSAVGISMGLLRTLANTIALIILCFQAYRAHGIKSDFSEARGVALALFVGLEAMILFHTAYNMMEKSNTEAKYTLHVLVIFTMETSMLLFIFGPIMAKERKRLRSTASSSTEKIHVTGLEQGQHEHDTAANSTATETAFIATTSSAPTYPSRNVDGDGDPSVVHDLKAALIRISSLESQLQAVQSRNEQLVRRCSFSNHEEP